MKLVGVDVSKYNGYPDWVKAKADGVQFAILRLGSGYGGGYVDKTFEYNYRECKKAGIGVGVYVASYLNITAEIDMTLKKLKGKQLEYPVYFDIEDFSLNGRSYTNTQLTNYTVRYCSEIERAGYYVGIYSNKAFLDSRLYWGRIKKYDIWIAHWNKGVNYAGKYGMHQYTNKGQWKGIPSTGEGGVDTNWCFVDYPSLMKKLGINGYKKQKAEVKGLSKMEEEKLLDEIKQTVVTYEDRDYDKAVKIAKQHKAVLVPAELNMDFGKMKRSKDTIIGIGDKTGKIDGENYGITGYCDYLVSADKVDEFLKDRSKFLRRK
ncbi:glycoside hydrolase family 25 protein [Finegoldia magna]|uniref:glycoside hydrolase family 25 protein n=1 Tax=Finegoldia magna TaxID=1260 RepID=UPI0023A95F8E|nr:glycoside hydrolase family 25 protein [Finegoldia magna]MCC2717235.1 glycoside hydrolase family 25 protein [Finegoldia magna]